MGYLICQRCGGYYKLREGESPDDFVSCQCYGPLVYVESLDEELNTKKKLSKSSSLNDDNVIDVNKTSYDEAELSNEIPSLDYPTKSYDEVELDESIESHKDEGIESHKDEDIESLNNIGSNEINKLNNDLLFINGSDAEEKIDLGKDYDSDLGSEMKDSVGLEKVSDAIDGLTVNEEIGSSNKSQSDGISQNKELDRETLDVKKSLEEDESESPVGSYSNYSIEEPAIKNRAYYRQAYYGDTKPDIKKYKLMQDDDSLITSLKYPDPKIKQEAVQALGVIGNKSALKPLEEFIKVESPNLKIYAEIAVNQIKSREYGFKSKNRDYYKNIYSSKKSFETPYSDENEEKGHKVEDKVISKESVSPVSSHGDVIPEKSHAIPETPLSEPIKTAKSQAVNDSAKDSNNVDIYSTNNRAIASQESSKTTPIDDAKSSVQVPETPEVGASEKTSINTNLNGDVGSESDASVTKNEFDVVSHDVVSQDSQDNSSETTLEDDNLYESSYLGHNIQEKSEHEQISVEKPSDIIKDHSSLEDNAPLKDIPSDIPSDTTSLDDTSPKEFTPDGPLDVKTKNGLNKNQVSTQSKLSGFADDLNHPNNKGTPIKIKEKSVISQGLTSKTTSSASAQTIKNPNATVTKDNDDIYFIKWLGIKETDKPLIGFIILFALSLVIGVLLTMGYK